MLSIEDNELLCRVGPGTPMGDVMRQYWQPVLLTSELAGPDCAPLRVRVLGEDLIAFRDSAGKPGLLGDHCPHRGASLFFGRNEEAGLRCVYHGWKFDVDGRCIDMPNEPAESTFKDKIHHVAYPCREAGGLIWAYLGPLAQPPGLPEMEFTLVPDAHRYVTRRVQPNNFAQTLEGEIDQSHVSFLHSDLRVDDSTERARVARIRSQDRHPHFEAVDTDYGVLIGARRAAGDQGYYWRITQFLMPGFTMTGPYGEDPSRTTRIFVPMDDETTMVFAFTYHPLRPINRTELERLLPGAGLHPGVDRYRPATSAPAGAWIPKADMTNDFFLDHELQRTTKFCGIPEFWAQDAACQVSMGPIYDRSQEHLGTSDTAIIKVRQCWINSAKALRERGVPPPAATDPTLFRVRGAAMLLAHDANWVEASAQNRAVVPDFNPAGV